MESLKITSYEERALFELQLWKGRMSRRPGLLNQAAKMIQSRTNKLIPEQAHQAITLTIKQITRIVMTGAGWISPRMIISDASLEKLEQKIRARIKFYRSTAAAEGAATGYGGFFWGLADLPLWMSIKMKMLFEIAANYGFDTRDYRERIYIMYIFQLAFSSQQHRNKIFRLVQDWDNHVKTMPNDFSQFDWRSYWEEYRDHIDLAKLLQLIPGFGALVGSIVNYKLTNRLGDYAMNAYRMRLKLDVHPVADRWTGSRIYNWN